MLIVNSRIRIPQSEFRFTFVRSSGPGGQNVNKVSSKAVLRWPMRLSKSLPADVRERFLARYGKRLTGDGDLIVSSQRYRDQGRNIADALDKVRTMLAEVATAPKKRRATKPSQGAVTRRIESKQARSRKKQLRRKPANDD
jgi:ribosome-associated protein